MIILTAELSCSHFQVALFTLSHFFTCLIEKVGLVDCIGGVDTAVRLAKEQCQLSMEPGAVVLEEYPKVKKSILTQLLKNLSLGNKGSGENGWAGKAMAVYQHELYDNLVHPRCNSVLLKVQSLLLQAAALDGEISLFSSEAQLLSSSL
jgi:hypothetical protein